MLEVFADDGRKEGIISVDVGSHLMACVKCNAKRVAFCLLFRVLKVKSSVICPFLGDGGGGRVPSLPEQNRHSVPGCMHNLSAHLRQTAGVFVLGGRRISCFFFILKL